MYLYLIIGLYGALKGSDKDMDDRDLLQAGLGAVLFSLIFSYLTLFLGLFTPASLLGAPLAIMLPGISGLILAPLIATGIAVFIYLAVVFPVAIAVRMR